PEIVIPDNTKTGAEHPCRYEPELNSTYRELAEHYGFAVIPTRPYKPRDKAKAEAGVQVAQRWIVVALRHRKFFQLGDLNDAIGELLDRLNSRPGCFMTTPRVYFAQAADGLFFRKFSEIHPMNRTPGFTVLAQGLWSAVLILSGTYESLIDYADVLQTRRRFWRGALTTGGVSSVLHPPETTGS